VAATFPTWTLRLFGNGPLEDDLRQQAVTLGVADSVEFAGHTTDVLGALREASIFALASRAEGFPISLLEASAMGLPSVCFACAPGVREIVDDGVTGALIRPGNVEQFASRLEELMRDEALRQSMGAASQERVMAYSPEAVMDRWQHVFELVYR
jgi:glycosyltransferase involved in cell wall biosynthesis